MDKQRVIVITGPTATGKTAFGAALAKSINGEVVSADSMLVYRHMDIGTAKPTKKEKLGIPHHMIDIVSPWDEYSVARYVEDAVKSVEDILSRKKTPIIVGGTNLYIDSLLKGTGFPPRAVTEVRKEIENRYDDIGGEAMILQLGKFDSKTAERLSPNDKKRIVRAFEVYLSSGKTISEYEEESKKLPARFEAVKFALTYKNREKLYEQIDKRTDRMLENGLYDEVINLLDMGVSIESPAMQAIGYKELADVVLNKTDIDSAIQKIKMESRRYAKRQLTWLRRDESVNWITRS